MFPHANSLLGSERSFTEVLIQAAGGAAGDDGRGGSGGETVVGVWYAGVGAHTITVAPATLAPTPGPGDPGSAGANSSIAGFDTATGGAGGLGILSGGADGAGGDAGVGTVHAGGNGANGYASSIDGTSRTYGSGGAGSGTEGTQASTANQGGGGSANAGGDGQAGVVVIRYIKFTMTASGGTESDITVSGVVWRVHKYTASGTFTVTVAN